MRGRGRGMSENDVLIEMRRLRGQLGEARDEIARREAARRRSSSFEPPPLSARRLRDRAGIAMLLGLALAIGVVALGTGLCRHGALLPALVGAVGLSLMGVALMLPHGTPEMIATMIGVSILAFGHHLNRKASTALS